MFKITKAPAIFAHLIGMVGDIKPNKDGSEPLGKRGTGTKLLTLKNGMGIFIGADSGISAEPIED